MPLLDPGNINVISLPIETKDKYKAFIEFFEKFISIIFMLLEFIIGCSILAIIIIYGWNILHNWDTAYLNHAKYIIKSIHKYWIGFLFIAPLIFFRVILLKLSKLRNLKEGIFDKGIKIYSSGGE